MKWLLGFPASSAPFLFLHAAIAATASYGGFTAAAVATLTSLLVARLTTDMSLWEGVAFSLEGLLIAAVVIQILAKVRAERQRLVAAANRIQALEAIEHKGQLIESAFARLQGMGSRGSSAVWPQRHRHDGKERRRPVWSRDDRIGLGCAAGGRREIGGTAAKRPTAPTRRHGVRRERGDSAPVRRTERRI
jgi:hypothetical protein